jgi:hypothetical protein
VLGTERPHEDRERTLVERLGLAVAALRTGSARWVKSAYRQPTSGWAVFEFVGLCELLWRSLFNRLAPGSRYRRRSQAKEQGVDQGRTHALAAAVLVGLFTFRVIAQLIQLIAPTPLLPPFDAWHSATLPFPMLAATQAIIIVGSTILIVRMWRRRLRPRAAVGKVLLWLGAVYFLGALFRFVAGFTFLEDKTFFAAHLAAFFHIVLASLVLTFADYYRRLD